MSAPPYCTAEFALLVEATRWPRPADESRLAALAAADPEWTRVLALVERHRVPGLVHHALGRAGIAAPATIAAAASAAAHDELKQVYETLRLVRLFAGEGIAVAALKGVTIARRQFGRFGLRSSIDIDLLVPEADVMRTDALLRADAYRRVDPGEDVAHDALARRNRRFKDMAYVHRGTGVLVELHWRLFTNRRLMHAVDLSTEPVELVPGHAVPALPADTALLYMAVHGGEHSWSRLKWLADLGAALGADPGAAARLYADARARGFRRMVGPGIALADRLYGTGLPPALARDLARDWRMRSLLRTARASLVGNEDGVELEDSPFATTRKNLSHYLVSNDPRHMLAELLYDWNYRGEADQGRSRILRMGERLWGMLSRR